MGCKLLRVCVFIIHFSLSYSKPTNVYERNSYFRAQLLEQSSRKSTIVSRTIADDPFESGAFRHEYPILSFGDNKPDEALVQRLPRRSDKPSWLELPKSNRMKHSKSTPYKRPEISLPPYHRLDRSKSETDELLRTSMSEGSNGGRSKSSSSKQGSSTSDIAIHAKKSQSLGSTKTPNEMLGKAGSSFTRDLLSEYMKKFPGICYTAGEALLVGGPYAPPAASTYMTVAGSLALTAGGATQLATTLHKICKVRRARRAELAAVKEQSKNVSPRLGNKSLQRLSAPSTSNRSGDLSSKSHFDPFSSTNSFSSQSKAQGVSVSKSIVGKSHRTKSLDLDLLEQGQLHQNQPKDSRASSTDIPEQEVSLTKAQLKRQYRQENWNKVCKVLKDPRMYARVLESAGGAAILASVQSGSTCPSDNSSNNSTWLTQWPVVAGIGARVAGKIVINGVDATEKARKKHNERIGKSAKGDNPEKDAEGRHSPKSSEGAGLMGEGFDFA